MVKDGYLKAGHSLPYKPAKVVKEELHKAPYKHMSDRVEVRKSFKDLDGHVKIGPKQIITNPPKQGQVGK